MSADRMIKRLMAEAESNAPFVPSAIYDPEGDCLEFFISDEPFWARRLDKWVTVYYGRDSNDIVGSLIKNTRELLSAFPGVDIYVEGGRVQLSHMLRAPAYSAGDQVMKQAYKAVIQKVEDLHLEAEFSLA